MVVDDGIGKLLISGVIYEEWRRFDRRQIEVPACEEKKLTNYCHKIAQQVQEQAWSRMTIAGGMSASETRARVSKRGSARYGRNAVWCHRIVHAFRERFACCQSCLVCLSWRIQHPSPACHAAVSNLRCTPALRIVRSEGPMSAYVPHKTNLCAWPEHPRSQCYTQ